MTVDRQSWGFGQNVSVKDVLVINNLYFIWFRQSDENQNITGTVEMYFRIRRKPTDAQKDGVACGKDGPFPALAFNTLFKK